MTEPEEITRSPLAKLFTVEFLITWTVMIASAVGMYHAMNATANEAKTTAIESLAIAKSLHESHQTIKTQIATVQIQIDNTNEKLEDSDKRINRRLDSLEEKMDRLLMKSE